MSRGVFITGTDTGIGKTTASCALLLALRTRGLRAVGMKPVASGSERTAGGWRNADALALQAASDPRPAYDLVNPYALPEPTAPEIAAALAGVVVDRNKLREAFDALRAQADFVLVEGVGGWCSPLAVDVEHADLARDLALPALLVVGLRLGCINHARLSAKAIVADGLPLLGWIGSGVDPDFSRQRETIAILDRLLPVPRLGLLSHGTDATQHSMELAEAARVITDA